MKWTIFKVKSDNLYDNHREKHKRNPATALPTIALAKFCKTGGHIALAQFRRARAPEGTLVRGLLEHSTICPPLRRERTAFAYPVF